MGSSGNTRRANHAPHPSQIRISPRLDAHRLPTRWCTRSIERRQANYSVLFGFVLLCRCRYTEEVFQSTWGDMENESWSCRAAMATPLVTPVLRILSLNDPIISYKDCVDQQLFVNLDKVI